MILLLTNIYHWPLFKRGWRCEVMTAIVCQLDLHLPMQPMPITTNICSHMFKSKSIVFKQDMQIKAKFVQMKMK